MLNKKCTTVKKRILQMVKKPHKIDWIHFKHFFNNFLGYIGVFLSYFKFEYLIGQSSKCALTIVTSRTSISTICVDALCCDQNKLYDEIPNYTIPWIYCRTYRSCKNAQEVSCCGEFPYAYPNASNCRSFHGKLHKCRDRRQIRHRPLSISSGLST